MHMYAKFDQNTICGSRGMDIYGRTDSHSDYSADPRVVQCPQRDMLSSVTFNFTSQWYK